MGYWMYTLETQHVKWMMPASTNMNYEIFGGTFIHNRPQPCTTLGGAVRVSNRLLVPNDYLSFSGDTIDGFVGYMLSRTPIGKRSDTDNANYWTIVVDTENFAGPVLYMSAWFWDSRINWSPKSVSWSDPRALVGYIAQGFEGGMGAITASDADGSTWMRTNQWALPLDQDDGALTSTLFTGHSQYSSDWAAAALEPMLSGSGSSSQQTPSAVRDAAMSSRSTPECSSPWSGVGFSVGLDLGDEEIVWEDLGVGTVSEAFSEGAENRSAGCSTTLTIDDARLDCESTAGWCEGDRYLKLDAQGTPTVVSEADVPAGVRGALELRSFQPSRANDGRYLGPPAATEAACFDTPGPAPADPRLYCTRTETGLWLGFQWYRFVDQPELNQVFASLPADEREEAKCYMQTRIERLHAAQQAGSELPSWFEPPQGEGTLPGDKAALDPSLLVTPPAGMEVGFVPITVFERKREKPPGCEVVLGTVTEEPDPIPAGYYDGHAWDGGGYDNETCEGNSESGGPFTYPGTIYGYPPGPDPTDRTGYTVPVRDAVSDVLSERSPTCGLPSDP